MAGRKRSPPPGSFAKLMATSQKSQRKDTAKPEGLASQPASKPAPQQANQQAGQDDIGPVVERGRMFYITQKVDRWIDMAVARLKDRGIHKADRSVVVNAILHNPQLYEASSLTELEEGVLKHLTSRYRRRPEDSAG